MTDASGTLLLWRFEPADGLRLHVWPNGAALAWSWSGSCWCRLDGVDSAMVAEAMQIVADLPPAWTHPQAQSVALPIVMREAAYG